ADILSGNVKAGKDVVVIGAGGIGFDVAEYLTAANRESDNAEEDFLSHWGVDGALQHRGALVKAASEPAVRQVTLMQRKPGRMGRSLGVSTGWILRLDLAKAKVQQVSGVSYERISDEGVHITVEGAERIVPADTVVICAGQTEELALFNALVGLGRTPHRIGGAAVAAELDAVRAIADGVKLAFTF
ncbi:MAG: FAD-dependent oxidoreductase, partial [Hyphomicrobiaceae bacterium]